MLRSKLIADYFEARLEDLVPGSLAPVALHLYFSRNRHVLVWKKREERITPDFLSKARVRGIARLWIHRDDRSLWEAYLKSKDMKSRDRPSDLLSDQAITERQRTAKVAKAARELLQCVAQNPAPEDQARALADARGAVRDILDLALESATDEAKSLANELWCLASIEPELEHGLNVATYAALFSMAFGRIDRELIADIALAGLLHDIGICQVSASAASVPATARTAHQQLQYAQHVDEGLRLIDSYASRIPERVRAMISQHQEKFDGTGYPKKLKGFEFNDLAQLLAMADTLDSFSSGRWDGAKRSVQETLRKLESIEKERSFPEYFNPDVFAAVLRWMSEPPATDSTQEASEIVHEKARQLLGGGGR